jgi:hypothetical protein
MSDPFLEKTLRLMGDILGIGAVKIPQRNYLDPDPPPLTPMGQDEVDQLGAQMHNAEVAQMLSQPGAMVLDTPLGRPRTEEEMTADFERTGVTQRPAKVLQSHELPKGTLTTRRIGAKP